jgi:hypothetical protein
LYEKNGERRDLILRIKYSIIFSRQLLTRMKSDDVIETPHAIIAYLIGVIRVQKYFVFSLARAFIILSSSSSSSIIFFIFLISILYKSNWNIKNMKSISLLLEIKVRRLYFIFFLDDWPTQTCCCRWKWQLVCIKISIINFFISSLFRGSTIAKIVGNNIAKFNTFEQEIRMYVYEELVDGRKLTEIINEQHENVKYLPGHKFTPNVVSEIDFFRYYNKSNLGCVCRCRRSSERCGYFTLHFTPSIRWTNMYCNKITCENECICCLVLESMFHLLNWNLNEWIS